LRTEGYSTSSWRYLRNIPELEYIKKGFSSPMSYRDHLPPYSRAAFLLSALLAEYDFIIEPAIRTHGLVVVESYYFRPLAKELIKGKSSMDVLRPAFLLPRPEAVILFDLPADEAFRRKGKPSAHEVLLQPTQQDFRSFQKRVLETSLGMVEPDIIHRVDAGRSHEEVYQQVKEIVARYPCKRQGPAEPERNELRNSREPLISLPVVPGEISPKENTRKVL
jgi:thymidylate kinase